MATRKRKARRRNPERSETVKYYRTQQAAERAAERSHKKYYSVTVWRVDDRRWGVHSKELKPNDLRNPSRRLPVGKKVRVFAKRLKNGRIELYR